METPATRWSQRSALIEDAHEPPIEFPYAKASAQLWVRFAQLIFILYSQPVRTLGVSNKNFSKLDFSILLNKHGFTATRLHSSLLILLLGAVH